MYADCLLSSVITFTGPEMTCCYRHIIFLGFGPGISYGVVVAGSSFQD